MISHETERVLVQFRDDLPGLSLSGLLSNQATFCVTLPPGFLGQLFLVRHTDYVMHLEVMDGKVKFCRNEYRSEKSISNSASNMLMLSWCADKYDLAVLQNGQLGLDDCMTAQTRQLFVPLSLLRWAREQHLLKTGAYESKEYFLVVIIEAIRQQQEKIKSQNSYGAFWDRSEQGYKPKREPDAVASFRALIQDHAILAGYDIDYESGAAGGALDIKIVAPLRGGGLVKIALECKNAHSPDIEHGISDQLPAYMNSIGADYGIYLVLRYAGKKFDKPSESSGDQKLALDRLKPFSSIVVEMLELGWQLSPSNAKYHFG